MNYFLQLLLFFALSAQLNSAFVFAQYLVEVLETSFGSQHPVLRCEAAGANFGANVLDFSLGAKAVGCAVFSEPRNACGPSRLRPLNDTAMYCDTYFAVAARGNCSFSHKAYNVQNSKPFGFDALIVYNDPNKPLAPMNGADFADEVYIPVVMVSYDCMRKMMGQYSSSHGFTVTIKASPGYYDLIKYLVPFVVIVGFCFIILFISLVIRLCRERRRLAKKRLSRSNLKKIPVRKYKKGENQETCAICLDDFVENEKVRVLPCSHIYHTKCVDQWLTKNRKVCPICKRKVGPANDSDSDSDTERNTINNSVATTSRDSEPLLTNPYNNPNQTNNGRPSILNIRWLPYTVQQHTTNPGGNSTEPLPNHSASTEIPPENEEEDRRPVTRRVGDAFSRAFTSIRRKFTRNDSNVHRRLENDDTLSSIILEPDTENPAHSNRFVAENPGYANSSNGDGTSLTTVHSIVHADVEPVPDEDHE
ncbi:E3 ubiquitin-protein ligase RNF13 [Aphelenchoides bicaudatus]|nr:E3 ubiquitin-protein ligase RNF13 [Aphelenchoides bicaudatus]